MLFMIFMKFSPQELRNAFDQERLSRGKDRLLLSIAVPAGQDYIDRGFDIPKIAK